MATPPNHRQRLEGSNLRGDSESEMWEERRRPTMAHRRGGPGKTRGHSWYHGAGHLWLVADGGLASLEKVRRQVGADLPRDAKARGEAARAFGAAELRAPHVYRRRRPPTESTSMWST